MKKLVTVFFLIFSSFLFAQDIKVANAVVISENPDWGIDEVILSNEPIGQFSGVQKSNQTVYVAVNDTLSTANLGLVILSSADGGENWTLFSQGITFRGVYEKIKLIRSGLDSIYCAFQIGDNVYCWNFLSGNFNLVLGGGYRAFDMVASSTGNLYFFADSLFNNSIVRYGSPTGGATWVSRGLVTSAGAAPKLYMSGTGDTLVLNYYGPIKDDTAKSIVRAARYRETGAGTMAAAGFQDVAADTSVFKYEFGSAMNNGEVFFYYTVGEPGSRDIMYRKSISNGTSYEAPGALAENPNVDEYGIDGKHYAGTGFSGFDFTYYADSAQTGPATNESDGVYYTTVSNGSTSFSVPVRVSDNPPAYSDNYSPELVSMPFSNADAGIVWAGNSQTLWDRLTAVIPVELTSFTASYVDGSVLLTWSTATETNNKGFEIQRKAHSAEGMAWEKIAFVEGKGTTTEKQLYSFVDKYNLTGKYLYRLKQIDFDGTVSYSDLVEVDANKVFTFALQQNYPNPFNPTTNLRFTIPDLRFVELKVYDILGNEIATLVNEAKEPGEYEIEWNAGQLPSGVYFYKIQAGDFTDTKKLILLK